MFGSVSKLQYYQNGMYLVEISPVRSLEKKMNEYFEISIDRNDYSKSSFNGHIMAACLRAFKLKASTTETIKG